MIFEISLARGRYGDPRSLVRFDASIYSQRGQDGWIAEIFRRIGVQSRFFIEIGIGDGTENNTRLLLEQGWRGIWIDGSADKIDNAKSTFGTFISRGKLRILNETVTCENVNEILNYADAPTEFDLFSFDIDQNTSHVWRVLTHRPRVTCVEYNSSIPASCALEVPYNPAQSWEGTNWFGASLKTMEQIGSTKGMRLVGCDLTGTDSFFVAGATDDLFRSPFTAEEHWEPARYDRHGYRGHLPSPHARTWIPGTA